MTKEQILEKMKIDLETRGRTDETAFPDFLVPIANIMLRTEDCR